MSYPYRGHRLGALWKATNEILINATPMPTMTGACTAFGRNTIAATPLIAKRPNAPPSRTMTNDMVDIMGSSGLAWHQWKKHGVCSGLDGQTYLDLSRQAYDSITRPPVFRKLSETVRVPAQVIEEAFLKSNPALEPDMITITCKQNMIQEARICLSKSLEPVPCGRDVVRDCTLDDALLPPIP
jgi:ribonuclease T2